MFTLLFAHTSLLYSFCVCLQCNCTVLLVFVLCLCHCYMATYIPSWIRYSLFCGFECRRPKQYLTIDIYQKSHSVPLYVDNSHAYRYCPSWFGYFHPRGRKRREATPPQTKPWAFMPQDKYRHSIAEAVLLYNGGVLRKFCLHLFDRWNINVHTSADASRWHFSTLRTQWNLNIASTEQGPRREIIGVLWMVPNWIVFC